MGRSLTKLSDQPDARTFAFHVARLMADTHCEDVLVLDVSKISQVTDFFVLGTGTSDRQMKSVAEDLKKLGQLEGHGIYRAHGSGSDQWYVVDFVDVVVHLFEPGQRAWYDLDGLWADAERVAWKRPAGEKPRTSVRVAADDDA